MPSDSNGVYSLPNGYEAVTGETIQASQHNPPLEDLASAMSQRLMRTGVAPMTGPLKITDGSVGSPGLKFNTDGTSGFYKTTNGIGVSISGTKVAEFTSSGASRMIGELISWTLLSAPAGWVLPYGQTLSRTTYAAAWAIAQDEISSGNTFFNNGDGSTTFGIGDMRGVSVVGRDNMGGTRANRVTATYFGGDVTALGVIGGSQSHTLTTAEIAAHSHANSLNDPGHNHNYTDSSGGQHNNTASPQVAGGTPQGTNATSTTYSASNITITNANAGGGGAHNNLPPGMILNFILFVGA